MAVFTAIATAIVGAVGLSGVLATIATSVIAGGLAYGTARALGVFKPPSMDTGPDPGSRIQLPPATDNKLPVIYGNVFTSGPIFDAAISNENQTMTYCIALSEETQTGSFTCEEVFMNDVKLVFTGNTVTSHVDPNQSTDTTYNGNVRLNIYQGGSAGSDVVFPTSGTGSSTAATAIVPHWGVNHTANNMVYAVLQIDYDAENGLTGLPQMTFKMKNTLNNPGDVLYDYLTSTRYGAGLSNAELDVNSITGSANTQMKGYSAESITYRNQSNVSSTHSRYSINGVISTFDTCSTNIDKICQASATFFTYDVKDGQFAAIPNRAISTAEKANCLVYNDDNIVSKIDISSTELYALYNAVEVEFADSTRKDQQNTVKVETPGSDRNPNEPDNVLNYRLDLVNDNMRAETLANIDLNQSRVGTVIQFESDYSGMQTDVGDVIKVTNSLYGWTDKLFRVMRCTEISTAEGMITVRISAIEYSDDYYVQADIRQTPADLPIDIPKLPIIGPIYLPQIYEGTYGNSSALPGTVFGGVITNPAMKTFGAGTQLEDAGLSTGTGNISASNVTYQDLITPQLYDLTDSDEGDFTFTAEGKLGGTITGAYDVAFRNNVTLTFANATNVQNVTYGGGGVVLQGVTDFSPQLSDNKKVSTDPVTNGLSASDNYKIANATIRVQGFSDIDASAGAPRRFGNMGFAMTRITKGEK